MARVGRHTGREGVAEGTAAAYGLVDEGHRAIRTRNCQLWDASRDSSAPRTARAQAGVQPPRAVEPTVEWGGTRGNEGERKPGGVAPVLTTSHERIVTHSGFHLDVSRPRGRQDRAGDLDEVSIRSRSDSAGGRNNMRTSFIVAVGALVALGGCASGGTATRSATRTTTASNPQTVRRTVVGPTTRYVRSTPTRTTTAYAPRVVSRRVVRGPTVRRSAPAVATARVAPARRTVTTLATSPTPPPPPSMQVLQGRRSTTGNRVVPVSRTARVQPAVASPVPVTRTVQRAATPTPARRTCAPAPACAPAPQPTRSYFATSTSLCEPSPCVGGT